MAGSVIILYKKKLKTIKLDKISNDNFLDINFFNLLKDIIFEKTKIEVKVEDIFSLEIPNHIEIVKSNTFFNFSELYRVVFQYKIKVLEEMVFSNCKKLRYIVFSNKNMLNTFKIDLSKNIFDSSKKDFNLISYTKNLNTKRLRNYRVNNKLFDFSVYVNSLRFNEEFYIIDKNVSSQIHSSESRFNFVYIFVIISLAIHFSKKYLKSIKKE